MRRFLGYTTLVPTSINRFLRYTTVGVSTLLLDLSLLWMLVNWLSINYLVATGASFFISVTINYAISRLWVFKGTERELARGYMYSIQIALVGALTTVAGMWTIVTVTGWHFLVARILVSGVVGLWNYLMNLFLNFQVAGKPLDQ